MSQNRSAAVMQQRSEPHSSLDDFPTPPWATRALAVLAGAKEVTSRELGPMIQRRRAALAEEIANG